MKSFIKELDWRLKFVSIALVILISLATIVSAIDTRYAKSDYVLLVELRLNQKIISDRNNRLQERIWKLEDKYIDENKMPQIIKDEYRKLKQELKDNELLLKEPYKKSF